VSKFAIGTIYITVLFSLNCFASSVCIVSAAEDKVVCDGKTLNQIADNTESFSTALKTLVDQGYKIVSQGNLPA
jgi:hypothetical protein